MTINAPAALLLLLYELVAEEQGVEPAALTGTIQNDVLKEYIARGNYIFPARPSMRLTVDTFRYCTERLPRFNTISISGYHIREAGSTAAQEIAFTLANGIAYVQAAVDAGLEVDAFARRLSFFFNAHNNFFQEVAKFRAARTVWAEVMRERFGARDERSLMLRFHAQTGGSTLTAQQAERGLHRPLRTTLSSGCCAVSVEPPFVYGTAASGSADRGAPKRSFITRPTNAVPRGTSRSPQEVVVRVEEEESRWRKSSTLRPASTAACT